MKHGIFSFLAASAASLALAATAHSAFAADLRVLTHSSFAVPKPLLAQFEKDAGVKLRITKAGDAGEMPAERIALVVIAHQQDGRRLQLGENRGEVFVSAVLAPMCEIAGDDHEGNIGMIAVDPVDGRREPFSRIEAVDLAAARDKMGVGEDDELHRAMVSRSHAL